jgi:hypothetical protein
MDNIYIYIYTYIYTYIYRERERDGQAVAIRGPGLIVSKTRRACLSSPCTSWTEAPLGSACSFFLIADTPAALVVIKPISSVWDWRLSSLSPNPSHMYI